MICIQLQGGEEAALPSGRPGLERAWRGDWNDRHATASSLHNDSFPSSLYDKGSHRRQRPHPYPLFPISNFRKSHFKISKMRLVPISSYGYQPNTPRRPLFPPPGGCPLVGSPKATNEMRLEENYNSLPSQISLRRLYLCAKYSMPASKLT